MRCADSDLIFSMVIPTPSTKQINFNLFVKALDKLAERADGNLGTTKVLIETIVKNGGPKSSGEIIPSARLERLTERSLI